MFEIKMTGIETLQKEIGDLFGKVSKGNYAGMLAVGNDLTKSLQAHIQTEVYDAYTPRWYQRRVDNPQYGTPMISEENIFFLPQGKYKSIETAMRWSFAYNPATSHALYPTGNKIAPQGDSLIKAIQNDDYFGNKHVSIGIKRPFWEHFYDENIAGAQIDSYYVKGFNSVAPDLMAVADYNVEEEDSDDKTVR